ncbi:hypothetical protein ACFRMQ_16865 [Kitasatospora sp. NPDC056783]|uniref:hypothetical protein n=1 Tax=Kitasatospora sp. NPDC056783 TaxID=3345943 RepID=UPI00367AD167
MSTLIQEQLRREALEIAIWAEGRPAPLWETLEKLGLLGDDSHQETGVGNTYGWDSSGLPGLGPLAPFGSWQSVAATILRKAEDSAGFDQSSTEFDVIRWINFRDQFETMPFLADITEDSHGASISSLSLRPVISAVTNLVGGLVTSDTLTGIINSIKKIAELAVQNKGRQQKNSNVQQGVLTVVNGDLRLGLLRTTVQMEYKTGKGYQQLNQQVTVSRLFGSLDYDKCVRNAETLLEWDGRDVHDWVNGASSSPYPLNTSPAWDN